MANRAADWLRQGRADLKHARSVMSSGSFEWSCFAAQQSAGKGIKAVFIGKGMEAWGHGLTALLSELRQRIGVSAELLESAKILDKHYIPTRYPNGFDTGAPTDFYSESEARDAIQNAEGIIAFCSDLLG